MSGFENWPASILRRWLLSAAAGPVIFLIGLAGRIALHDPTLLTLSTLLASCTLAQTNLHHSRCRSYTGRSHRYLCPPFFQGSDSDSASTAASFYSRTSFKYVLHFFC